MASMTPVRFALFAVALTGCEHFWGGDFGNDAETAMRELATVADRVGDGGVRMVALWEPGELDPGYGVLTYTRVMVEHAGLECPAPIVDGLCTETARIRKKTGASVEIWCRATSVTWGCRDGRRSIVKR
jgi:hypothetical protein